MKEGLEEKVCDRIRLNQGEMVGRTDVKKTRGGGRMT